MAKKSASKAAEAPALTANGYEPERVYRVRLKRPVTWSGLKYLPRDPHDMTGAFIELLIAEGGDVVDNADPV